MLYNVWTRVARDGPPSPEIQDYNQSREGNRKHAKNMGNFRRNNFDIMQIDDPIPMSRKRGHSLRKRDHRLLLEKHDHAWNENEYCND